MTGTMTTTVHQSWCTDHARMPDGSSDWCESRVFRDEGTGAFVLWSTPSWGGSTVTD